MSVVSETFYKEHLLNCKLNPIASIVKVECADGQALLYLGYIEAEMSVVRGLPDGKPLHCIVLVVPDTKYSSKTPLILGILEEFLQGCEKSFGVQFLQKADLHTPWYLCFRAITLRRKALARNHNRIAIIRSALPEKIILRPNETLNVKGLYGWSG